MEENKDNLNMEYEAIIINDEKDTTAKKKEEQTNWKKELFDLIKTFILCLVVVILLTNFVFKPVHVEGDSMYPTLHNNELGIMNIFLKKVNGVQRQDVVIVYNKDTKENWVKRVIGMPGDKIYAKNDIVYINGKPLDEPYLDNDYVKSIRKNTDSNGNHVKFTEDFPEITLKENEYFLMGDNRVVSYDSRAVGPFDKEDIVGKDVYVFYPFQNMKIVRNN